MSRYDNVLPGVQLRMLDAERAHLDRLGEAARMWDAAAQVIEQTRKDLHDYTKLLRKEAWHDEAGADFSTRVAKSVESLDAWRDTADRNLRHLHDLLRDVHLAFPDIYEKVRAEHDGYEQALKSGVASPVPFSQRAGAQTERLDAFYYNITWTLIYLASGPDWAGPRAELPSSGSPGSPSGSPAAGSPPVAGSPAPATVPEPQSPESPAPGEQPRTSDPLSAAANALQAAQGLLDGMQLPDPVSVPDPGSALNLDPAAYAQHAPYGQPALAGLDAGTSAGGPGAGTTSLTGPGTGNPAGTGSAPVPTGLAGGTSGSAASGGSTPPMMPPGGGAGAAGARPASGGIKPGNSDRPVAESRPRPRRGPVTPGVALTGRAGAAQPTPAARRGWDSDNDSLQVLDEQLWQVNPQEEETHGQDRRGPGRDGRDRAAAHRAPDAGLVGPGRRADQPTRAR